MVKAWVAAAFLSVSLCASAAPITFAFTGVLDQAPVLDPDSPFPDPVDDTTAFSGTYTFDGAATDGAADPQTGAYQSSGGPYGFTLAIGGLTFAYSSIAITVADNFVGLGDLYGASFAEPSNCGKFSCAYLSLALIDPGASALSGDGLPTKPPAFGSFLYSTFLYQDTVGGDQIELDGHLTSLSCTAGCTVPEPPTVALVAAALAGLAWRPRRLRAAPIRRLTGARRASGRRHPVEIAMSGTRPVLPVLFALFVGCLSGAAQAVDGVTLIDQNHAIAGNITPGDTPGFPVSINLPGIYKLASNLVVPNAATTAIQINVDNVTIDLNGFAILGPNVCATDGTTVAQPCTLPSANPFNGVGVDGGSATPLLVKNTRVMNGTIDGMGGYGIFLNVNSRVERMNVTQSGNYAIFTSGGVILDTLVRGNGGGGIVTTGGIVSGSRSLFNRGFGLFVTGAGLVNGNIVQGNLDVGMNLGGAVRYTDNVVYGNVNVAAQQVVGGTQAGANTCIFNACP